MAASCYERMVKKQHKIILAVVAVVILSQSAALGCTCDHLPKNSTAFRKAKAVFIGQVTGDKAHGRRPDSWGDDQVPFIDVVTFKVEKGWKGASSSEVTVWLDFLFFNCSGLRFREGEKYLVYADKHKGSLVVYWCAHAALTTSLSSEDARKQIRQLDSFWFRLRARLFPI